MNLQEDHPELKGNWWDPRKPTEKWHGTLMLKAGQPAALNLIQYGEGKLQASVDNPFEGCGLIHGTTGEGKAVTLSQCFASSHSRSFGSEEVEVTAYQAVFGAHLSIKELVFDEVQVEFDYLNDWVSHSRYEEKNINDGEDRNEVRFRLNPNYQIPFEAPGYAKSLFFLGYRTKSSKFRFSIESSSNLQLTYSRQFSLRNLLDDLLQWTWFFTLATRHQTRFSKITVYRHEVRFQLGAKSIKQPLELWVSVAGKREKEKALHPPDMNFTLPDIEKDLTAVVTRWKNMQTEWAATLHRYFATLHREGLRLPEEFLFRAQAVEALHWRDGKTKKTNQRETYGEAWEKAPASLQARLGDKIAFVDEIRINRNYLTHYNPEDEGKSADLAGLYELSQKLGFLLEAVILNELGLPQSVVEGAFSTRRWGHLVKWDDAE
jgi:hypothetical protein